MDRRRKTILDDDDMGIALSWYQPGETMAEHRHEFAQVSVLFSGAFREISDARSADNQSGYVGVKAPGLQHANCYGEHGALILSINLADPAIGWPLSWNWKPASPFEMSLARQIATGAGPDEVLRAHALDLVALMASDLSCDRRPAGWALDLRDRLAAGEIGGLEAAARQLGLHPAYLSRGFRKWFGVPPSLFALRCRMSHAVGALARGEPAAMAAQSAGFSDQSHLIRTLRRETGMTPRQLSRLIAA